MLGRKSCKHQMEKSNRESIANSIIARVNISNRQLVRNPPPSIVSIVSNYADGRPLRSSVLPDGEICGYYDCNEGIECISRQRMRRAHRSFDHDEIHSGPP